MPENTALTLFNYVAENSSRVGRHFYMKREAPLPGENQVRGSALPPPTLPNLQQSLLLESTQILQRRVARVLLVSVFEICSTKPTSFIGRLLLPS